MPSLGAQGLVDAVATVLVVWLVGRGVLRLRRRDFTDLGRATWSQVPRESVPQDAQEYFAGHRLDDLGFVSLGVISVGPTLGGLTYTDVWLNASGTVAGYPSWSHWPDTGEVTTASSFTSYLDDAADVRELDTTTVVAGFTSGQRPDAVGCDCRA